MAKLKQPKNYDEFFDLGESPKKKETKKSQQKRASNNDTRKRTTIYIDEEILTSLKLYGIKNQISVSSLIEKLAKDFLLDIKT